MFDNLSEQLENSFRLLKGKGKITELNVAESLRDVRRALLNADVNYKVAKSFTDSVKQKALGQNVLAAVEHGQSGRRNQPKRKSKHYSGSGSTGIGKNHLLRKAG